MVPEGGSGPGSAGSGPSAYRLVNLVVLALLAVFGLYVGARCAGWFMTPCPLRVLTGHDCILCGCTRDFSAMLSGHAPSINPASPWLLGGFIAEVVFRVLMCKWYRVAWLRRADAIAHGALLAVVALVNAMNLIMAFRHPLV